MTNTKYKERRRKQTKKKQMIAALRPPPLISNSSELPPLSSSENQTPSFASYLLDRARYLGHLFYGFMSLFVLMGLFCMALFWLLSIVCYARVSDVTIVYMSSLEGTKIRLATLLYQDMATLLYRHIGVLVEVMTFLIKSIMGLIEAVQWGILVKEILRLIEVQWDNALIMLKFCLSYSLKLRDCSST